VQDPAKMRDLSGGARGLDNLLYRCGPASPCLQECSANAHLALGALSIERALPLTHSPTSPTLPPRSADADFSCFADLALTSPVDYYKEGQGSLMQVRFHSIRLFVVGLSLACGDC